MATKNLTFSNSLTQTPNTTSNPFDNDNDALLERPTIQNFTATGRPLPMSDFRTSKHGGGTSGLTNFESLGAGAPNLLPVKFTDDSIISVPVRPPPTSGATTTDMNINDDDGGPIQQPKSRRFSLTSFKRKLSSSTSGPGSSDKKQPDFIMRDMTRREYLKHYAKDENRNYIGTEEPAEDCILDQVKKESGSSLKQAFDRKVKAKDMKSVMVAGGFM